MEWMRKAWGILSGERRLTSHGSEGASLRPEDVAVLVRAVEKTPDEDCSCDEASRHLDEYADRVQRGEDVATLMPLIRRHLECCPDCAEEFAALQQMLSHNDR